MHDVNGKLGHGIHEKPLQVKILEYGCQSVNVNILVPTAVHACLVMASPAC
jgi:hypothetical protein